MHYKTLSSEIVQQNPWWSYKHDKYSMPNGQEGDYFYGEAAGAVMIVPILEDGRLVLLNQYRYLGDRPSIEFPCGGIEAKEFPVATAQRELKEETGFRANDLVSIGSFEPSRTFFKDRIHIFVARELDKVAEQNLDDTEIIEIIYRRIDEFDDMIKRGEIWDGQTLAAWAMVRDFLRAYSQSA